MAVFGQVRFNNDLNAYNAEFTNVSGLREGNLVRVAGVEVGKVQSITVNDDATVRVVFTADPPPSSPKAPARKSVTTT